MRYDLVVGGQIVPVHHELGVNEYAGLLNYMPSLHEIVIIVGGMGIVATAFLLGERVFKGHKSSDVH
jgi:molybdopterin-containing oxidoreductase family membrane subunit